MACFGGQIEEILGLLSSKNKEVAYLKLLNLQELSAVDSSAVEILAASSRALLSSVVADIFDTREEIAGQALKSLGFMIYHPTIVASIGGDDAGVIIESVVKAIVTTNIKSVCTLGIWCISVQQFSSSLLDQHFQSLLRAIIHALDNPMGSLSITFEAMQAVVKLSSLLTECMRKTSSVWAPPIYRRLISSDKRDRNMSERCLLKIMPLICPPPLTLSKALAADLKIKLLSALKELNDQGMKLQSLQAWGFYIRLLGSHGLKNKPLINDMLKILEQTFSDFDSQVQIASLVAWQDLINVLIEPVVKASHISITSRRDGEEIETSNGENAEAETERFTKRIKLIMAPLIGIISSKCEVSVHASCLSTWSYLLHKLEASASCRSVMNSVWEPILEVVFKIGPTEKNMWLWDLCLDFLDALILGRNQATVDNLHNQEIQAPLKSSATGKQLEFGVKYPMRPYSVNFSPWKLCQLGFFIKMISILIRGESNPILAPELRRLASYAAFRLFQSLVGAVQKALLGPCITYDELTHCLNTIFTFITDVCKNVTSVEDRNYKCTYSCLKFLRVVAEGLEPSILGSPLYKMGLEIKIIRKVESADEIRYATVPGICSIDLEESVLPVVYLSIFCFSVVVNLSSETLEYKSALEQMEELLKFLLTSYQPEQVLQPFVVSLYSNNMPGCLQIWAVLVNSLKERIDCKSNQPGLKMEMGSIGYSSILHLLSYPIVSWLYLQKKLHLPLIIEAWKSLFESIIQNAESINWPVQSFCEDLSAVFNVYLDQIALAQGRRSELQLEEKKCKDEFRLLCGNAGIYLLKHLTCSISSERKHIDCDGRKLNTKNSILLASRVMNLFSGDGEETRTSDHSVAPRFLSELVNFARCLHRSEDVILLVEATSNSLLESLSRMHLLDVNTCCQLQLLWKELLNSLRQSRPSLKFDSSFLKSQDLLLAKTLDHQNPAISEATIEYWNSTYGVQNKLEFPRNLIAVLDKLYRNGKISICSRDVHVNDGITLKKCSKRVQIACSPADISELHVGSKRRRYELTEHQKEVRQAQRGRAMDCNGHGPGLRTYTSADFSQGNEDSQDCSGM